MNVHNLFRTRLIKKRNLPTLLNVDIFYPLSTWPQDIQLLFWKKTIGDADTFELMLLFLGNGGSSHEIEEWILTSQHWATLEKADKEQGKLSF